MPRCAECNADNPEDFKFCGHCGTRFGQVRKGTASLSGLVLIKRSTKPAGLRRSRSKSQATDDPAERRQLTVMFCDLADYTPLSARLDPEQLHAVLQDYHALCEREIGRFDGHIAQYLGDGVLVYFGYPTAHEDDPQRAVRAGLAILDGFRSLATRLSEPLRARIGVHTGPVVVGQIGTKERAQRLAIGETPNLAARLQSAAADNTLVISPATYRLVEGLFVCESLGLRELKGIARPLDLFRVTEESLARSRFEFALSAGLTGLVGRAEERAALMRAWDEARQGSGRVVLVAGEAGIGKSRLAHALRDRAQNDGATPIELQCSPYYRNTPFYPVVDSLRRLLRFDRDELPATKLEKVARVLARYGFAADEAVPLIATLLSLPLTDRYRLPARTPQKLRERTQSLLLDWLCREADRNPVLGVCEDLHWADPSTLQLVNDAVDRCSNAPMMLVFTARPEFSAQWVKAPHASHLMLAKLEHDDMHAMVTDVMGGKPLPRAVVEQIVSKADGVPLFVEEVTKAVRASGLLRELDDRYELDSPLGGLEIPATLHASLTARLDRLGPARDVAQLASVIGREFSYELLASVSPRADGLSGALRELVQAEIIYQRGNPPRADYLFKHALIRDAAYESLLRTQRERFHGQIARTLEDRFNDVAAAHPELLAHHYSEARMIAPALTNWQRAIDRALDQSANLEAINHIDVALKLLASLPDPPEQARWELQFQTSLGNAHLAVSGFASSKVGAAFGRARDLGAQAGQQQWRVKALMGLWTHHIGRGEFAIARELADQAAELGATIEDPAYLAEALLRQGSSLFYAGELCEATACWQRALEVFPKSARIPPLIPGQDPRIGCSAFLSHGLWLSGYPDRALQVILEARELARELRQPFGIAFSTLLESQIRLQRGEWEAALKSARDVEAICTEQGFPQWLGAAQVNQGSALAELGGVEAADLVERSFASAGFSPTTSLAQAGAVLLKLGRLDRGLLAIDSGLGLSAQIGELAGLAELHRLRGELLLASPNLCANSGSLADAPADPSASFRRALDIARQQGALSFELRAAMSLARLWQSQGRDSEARAIVREVYDRFTEGFDTADLCEARALLDRT